MIGQVSQSSNLGRQAQKIFVILEKHQMFALSLYALLFEFFFYCFYVGKVYVNKWNVCVCVCVWAPQTCPTLCNPMDSSPPGSSVYGISQPIILEWVAIASSRGSSSPRGHTQISHIGKLVLYHWATTDDTNISFKGNSIQPSTIDNGTG